MEELYRSEVDSTGGGLTFHDALDDCTVTWDTLKSAKFAAGLSNSTWLAKSVMSTESMALKIRAAKEKKGQAAPVAGPTGVGSTQAWRLQCVRAAWSQQEQQEEVPRSAARRPSPEARVHTMQMRILH